MSKYFVIGDVHGRLDLLISLLSKWDKDEEQLVFLGDYIDYGPNSREVLKEIHALTRKYQAIPLMGNHERGLLQFLGYDNSKEKLNGDGIWNSNGRKETYKSFLRDKYEDDLTLGEISKLFKDAHMKELEFMDNMDLYLETEKYILSHSGIDLMRSDWQKSEEPYFHSGKGEFIRRVNKTGKVIIFGHYRTGVIRGMNKGVSKYDLYNMPFLNDTPWVSPDGTKLGIDGGGVFGGFLHGAHIDDNSNEITVHSVGQNTKVQKTTYKLDEDYNKLTKK